MADRKTLDHTSQKLTKKEIAQICGISRITLDRVLHGLPGVGEAKRKEVLAYLQENGYRKNLIAQSLVRGESRSFGIIVFDLNNSFYAQMVNAFQQAAQEAGYVSYIMLSNKNPKTEQLLLEDLLSRQVDGIVLNSAVKEPGYGGYLLSQGTPILSVMNRIEGDVPFLGFDEYASMRELTAYALSRGFRRFYYVCPPLARKENSNMDSLLRRKQGFDDALSLAPEVRAQTLDTPDFTQKLCEELKASGESPCILCTSDIYAVEIHRALMDRGLESPKDYAIAGYDNIPMLHSFNPRLTTVSLNIAELGATAARLLADTRQGNPLPAQRLMPHTLIKMDTL